MLLQIKKTSDKATVPVKGSADSAGYDLYSIDENVNLQHAERKLFKTGIHIQIPSGYYGRIAPRSGLALKQGIDVMAGVVDSDYTGEIGVILINLNNMPVTVDTTKPIAQFIIEKHFDVDFELVDELDQTKRGSGGFGSTDLNKIISKQDIPRKSLEDMYNEVGGVPIKESYTEKMKKQQRE